MVEEELHKDKAHTLSKLLNEQIEIELSAVHFWNKIGSEIHMNLLKSKTYRNDLNKITCTIDVKEFSNCTFLLTGGLGLICSAIVDFLIECEEMNQIGIKIIVAGRNKQKFEERYSNFPFVEFMLYEALDSFNYANSIDYIIHGAGLASPEKYKTAPVETMLSNINGIYRLLEYCKCHYCKRILYISSSEVYGVKETDAPYHEKNYGYVDLDSVRSSYPVAKRASEMLCRSYVKEYGINAVIVRPGHIYGPSATENDKRISSEFAYRAAKGENIELKSSGTQKRSYMYSLDCVKAILMVLLNGHPGEAYNIGAESVTTIKEMASFYAKAGTVSLLAVDPTEEEAKVFNPMNNASLDIGKIKQFGYKDSFSVKEGFKHTVKILKEVME